MGFRAQVLESISFKGFLEGFLIKGSIGFRDFN